MNREFSARPDLLNIQSAPVRLSAGAVRPARVLAVSAGLLAFLFAQPVIAAESSSTPRPLWAETLRSAFRLNISGKTDEAYSRYRAAIAAAEKAQDSKGIIICLCALADFYDARGILSDQQRPRERALELARGKFGKESPEYAQQLARMGGWLARTGSTTKAGEFISEAGRILGEPDSKYPLEKASCYIATAHLQIARKELLPAEESYRKALALQESRLLPDTPVVLKTCKEYASLLERLGQKTEAEKLSERVNRARDLQSKASGKLDNGSFLMAVHEGRQADLANDRARALSAWKKAVAEAEKRPDLDNELPFALVRLGDEYRAGNKIEQALKLYKIALHLRESSGNENTLGTARNLERLALCCNACKKWSESEALLKRALGIEQKVQADNKVIAATMESLIPACMAQKDMKQAESIARELLAISERQSGREAENTKRIASGVLGSIYIQTGRTDEGMKIMKELSKSPAYQNAFKDRRESVEKQADQSELRP